MAGSRKVQRSVRVLVAVGLLALATVVVASSVVTATWVSVAAVFSLVAGMTAARIIYTEVTQTRAEWARDRAAQARSFGETLTRTHVEHATYARLMDERLTRRAQTITELNGTIRLAERRADYAEEKVKREARRANDAQERLAVLLDEVLAQRTAEAEQRDAELAEPGAEPLLDRAELAELVELADLPTLVDLMAWEERANEALLDGPRAQGGLPREA